MTIFLIMFFLFLLCTFAILVITHRHNSYQQFAIDKQLELLIEAQENRKAESEQVAKALKSIERVSDDAKFLREMLDALHQIISHESRELIKLKDRLDKLEKV